MALSKIAVTAADLPSGSVLQVVSATTTTSTSITATSKGSGTSTGLAVAITPSSTSNKLLIQYVGSFNLATHANPAFSIEIHDGSSVVYTDENSGIYINGDGDEHSNRWRYPVLGYITPSSTNAITYTVRAWKSGNACTAQHSNHPSTIAITEIAG